VGTKSLESMSTEALWNFLEEARSVLSIKLAAEKRELERRLVQLNGRIDDGLDARRPYPKVRPKYCNPEKPSETWSGRENRPRWMSA
jgi:DNA-binding protein H-NS